MVAALTKREKAATSDVSCLVRCIRYGVRLQILTYEQGFIMRLVTAAQTANGPLQ
jgi:hypothetical protein